ARHDQAETRIEVGLYSRRLHRCHGPGQQPGAFGHAGGANHWRAYLAAGSRRRCSGGGAQVAHHPGGRGHRAIA
ncbi:Uncharacterized protein APZ42_002635, partial [Daphnia magna]